MGMRSDVVALYVDPRGPYPKLVAEWYDEARDARTYAGPWPVVAHPPCGPWSSLAHLSKRPQDRALFAVALAQVRRFGGVLEHPARSRAWKEFGLPVAGVGACNDPVRGYTIEVQQVDWGHVARKKTWLYIVGHNSPPDVYYPPKREPTHWCSGFRSTHGSPARYKANGCAVPPGIKICSAQQRRRTPPAFAEWLLDLAAQARRP